MSDQVLARHLLKRSYQSFVPTTAPLLQRELPQLMQR